MLTQECIYKTIGKNKCTLFPVASTFSGKKRILRCCDCQEANKEKHVSYTSTGSDIFLFFLYEKEQQLSSHMIVNSFVYFDRWSLVCWFATSKTVTL